MEVEEEQKVIEPVPKAGGGAEGDTGCDEGGRGAEGDGILSCRKMFDKLNAGRRPGSGRRT